jgi:DNA mismatch repair protein MutS2
MSLLDPIPSPVVSADLVALEWEPLLALVAGFSASPIGRAEILALKPSADEEWIARQHQLTAEVRLLLAEQVSIPLGGLFDPTQLAAKARIPEAALEAAELQAVARLANDVAAVASGARGGQAAGAVGIVGRADARLAAVGRVH